MLFCLLCVCVCVCVFVSFVRMGACVFVEDRVFSFTHSVQPFDRAREKIPAVITEKDDGTSHTHMCLSVFVSVCSMYLSCVHVPLC